MTNYKFALMALLLFTATATNAQTTLSKSVIANGGISFTGSSVSADWTIGQTVINQVSAGSNIVTEGFHPVENLSTGIDEVAKNSMTLQSYPNPASDVIHISLKQNIAEPVTLQVMDVTGSTVNGVTTFPAQFSMETDLDVSALSAGIYFVTVNASKANAQVMKVIKK